MSYFFYYLDWFEALSFSLPRSMGNGEHINLWHDKWPNVVMTNLFSIPEERHYLLNAKVKKFIIDYKWFISLIPSLFFA